MKSYSKSPRFLRFALFFFGFLILYSIVIGYIFIKTTFSYEQEVNQRLNKDIAGQIVKDASPFLNGSVDDGKMQDLMHYLMSVNPSIEIYVLNETGEILTYVAPHKVVKMNQVDVEPVREFIASDGEYYLKGDDPRNPGNSKIFSAAPVVEEGHLLGYVYVILASQEYDGIASIVQDSTILQLALKTFLIILFISVLIGFLVFWLTTKNLSRIIEVFRRYQAGDMKARINLSSRNPEFMVIEDTFNEMADSLEQKITQINEVDSLRKELIANISHDLRTPVASILGYTELLLDKDESLSPEDRRKYLSIVEINSRKIEKQIQDLFDLSKLESAHYKLHLEPVHLGELITDISNKYKLLANKKGLNLNTIFSKELPIIRADIALIDRALQNLVDNALKYSDKGDTINIDLGQLDNKLVITVSDTGQGIAEAELPYVFDRFKMGKQKNSTGTGLGLAIVKKIIDLHNYTIHVISKEKVGTTFTVSIPVI